MDVVATEVMTTQWFEQPIASFYSQTEQTQTENASPYMAVGTYDIGSGATKYMGAIVDVHTLSLVDIFCEGSIPVLYRQDLIESENNTFSDLIMEIGLTALETAKYHILQEYTTSDYQLSCPLLHYGVATAAFREASNAELFSHHLSDVLEFPIDIISQEQEGILAYYSALSQAPAELALAPVVWDIGGGSMQLTFKDQGSEFHIMGSDVASQTFLSMVLTELLDKEVTDTPHPLNQSQVATAIDFAKSQFDVLSLNASLIENQVEQGAPVLAVGSVHNFVILPLCHLINGTTGNVYTKDDLYNTITALTNKTDQEILAFMAVPNAPFVKNQLTSLILVYAVMDLMGIDSVQTVKSGNIQGAALQFAEKQTSRTAIAPFIKLEDPLASITVH